MRRTIVFKRYNSFLVVLFATFFSPAVISFIYLINQNTDIVNIIYKFLSKILLVNKIDFDLVILLFTPYFLDIFLFYKYTTINIFYCFILPLSLYTFHFIIMAFYFDILQYYNLIY
jgi:hypothetical protein